MIFTSLIIFVLISSSCNLLKPNKYPVKDITNIVVFGAGGGTDVCNKKLMAEMAVILGVNINVINVVGGIGGSNGMIDAYSRASDGYTICGLSESSTTAAVQGAWDKKMEVWDFFIIGASPLVLSVSADSKYKTIEELVAAAKSNPSKIKAGASAAGSIHHLNLLAFEKGADVKLNYIPYKGSADAQNALLTGEIEVVVSSIAEQKDLLKAGKFLPLGMMIPEDFDFDGKKIPTSFGKVKGLEKYLPINQAISFAVKADAKPEVKAVLTEAFNKAMATDSMREFAKANYYVLSGSSGEEAKKIFASLESNFSWTLFDLGAAKVDPSTLGIQRQ